MSKPQLLPIIFSLSVLFLLNLLMISSLAPSFLLKQLLSWLIGIFFFFIGRHINPKQSGYSKWFFLAVSCLFLFLPIFLNNITRGSRRWLDFGFLSFQPAEIFKPFLMLFLANSTVPVFHLLPVIITAIQPDLGSAISILFLSVPNIIYHQKLFIFTIFSAVGLIFISPLIWSNFLHDYQKNRILTFINPFSDPRGKGYNVIQSKIAIGSGGLWGKGYKKGTQGQLLFLPEKHTDFMFSASVEELGITGAVLIILAYYLLIKSLLDKAYATTTNRSLFLFTLGICLQIWLQVFVNIGMNLGLLPVTGIPLPFLSVGGSSIISTLFAMGIIYAA